MNSRRWNLRTISGKTQSTPQGLTGRSGPYQGRQGFAPRTSVGSTYGYSRCPASRDCGTQRTAPATQAQPQAVKQNANHNFYVARPTTEKCLTQWYDFEYFWLLTIE
jgi:hypothetical protein